MSTKVNIEKPKKAPAKRAKKQMTPQEVKELLTKSISELDGIMKELTEEKTKLQSLNLKRTNELIDETLKNLTEDSQEMREKLKELDNEVVEE